MILRATCLNLLVKGLIYIKYVFIYFTLMSHFFYEVPDYKLLSLSTDDPIYNCIVIVVDQQQAIQKCNTSTIQLENLLHNELQI